MLTLVRWPVGYLSTAPVLPPAQIRHTGGLKRAGAPLATGLTTPETTWEWGESPAGETDPSLMDLSVSYGWCLLDSELAEMQATLTLTLTLILTLTLNLTLTLALTLTLTPTPTLTLTLALALTLTRGDAGGTTAEEVVWVTRAVGLCHPGYRLRRLGARGSWVITAR